VIQLVVQLKAMLSPLASSPAVLLGRGRIVVLLGVGALLRALLPDGVVTSSAGRVALRCSILRHRFYICIGPLALYSGLLTVWGVSQEKPAYVSYSPNAASVAAVS